jgi:transposase
MITVELKEIIRKEYFLKRKSIRQIARELHHSRDTVRKAVRDPGVPVYTRKKPPIKKSIGPFCEVIRQWLEEDQRRPAKQRHTARRIFDRLRDEHAFMGTDRTVRREVSLLRAKLPESHVPQTYLPADGATFDFGKAQVIFQGLERTVHLACMRLDCSSKFFVCALPTERRESLFESHLRGFAYLGGIPLRVRYDNLTTAVYKILNGRNREEQSLWVAFRSHYLFEAHYCAPGKGQEKGGVENLVGYARRNFLVPLPEVESFDELNDYLLDCCERDATSRERFGKTVEELWNEEREKLQSLPERLPKACVVITSKVNRRQMVRLFGIRYSVPPQYVGQVVTVQAFVFQVIISFREKTIAVHERSYERDDEVLDPQHYLPVLLQKPGAFDRATPIVNWSLPAAFSRYHMHLKDRLRESGGTKEYIRILILLKDNSMEEVTAAIKKATGLGVYSFDGVKNLLYQLREPAKRTGSLEVQSPAVWPNQVNHFDRLLQGGAS